MLVNVKKDLSGERFGRLTVICQAEDYINPNTNRHYAQWECKCDCGNIVIILGGNLGRHANSCGCLEKELTYKRLKKFNKYDLTGEYGIGWTSNTNQEFYFDLEDYDLIKDYCWYEDISKNKSPTKILRAARLGNSSGTAISMHEVLGFKNYDHINRNEFDNRKCNLRKCTTQQNSYNKSKPSNNTSNFIGVSWNKAKQKWVAYIGSEKKRIHLGYFSCKEDAIKARLEAEAKYHKEFAPQRDLFEDYGIV